MRRKEFLRPEGLLPVAAVAKRLGLSAATVHEAINAGKVRSVLFASVRRVRPEDLAAYEQSLNAAWPPAGEDWCTVADLVSAARVSRSQAYRLLARGTVPFRVFAGVRRIRREDIATFAGSAEAGDSPDGTAQAGQALLSRLLPPWERIILSR